MRSPFRPSLAFATGLCLFLAGCEHHSEPLADETRYPLSADTEAQIELVKKDEAVGKKPDVPSAELASKIEAGLVSAFGSPAVPVALQAAYLDPVRLARGRQIFVRNCSHCHGYYGRGDGPTAPFLYPRPRDFSRLGIVKFKSTGVDIQFPNIEKDLETTIKNGIQSTAMPAFGFPFGPPSMHQDTLGAESPNNGVKDVAQYVALLMMRARLESLLVNTYKTNSSLGADDIAEQTKSVIDDWKEAQDPEKRIYPTSPEPSYTESSLAAAIKEGDKVFHDAQLKCAACHGEQGRGDGTSMKPDPKNPQADKDDWGYHLEPRDLTRGIYRGGRRPIDLYRRIRAGIKGTPMPGFNEKTLPDEKAWALIEYVRSLALETPAKVGS